MKCPYIWNTVECTHQKDPRYKAMDVENADGTPERLHLTCTDTSYTRIRHFHDCLKEECAAWRDGKCQRGGM